MEEDRSKEKFPMIGEASRYFEAKSVGEDEFLIEIRGEKKFKKVWLVKLNELETCMEEVNYYNEPDS